MRPKARKSCPNCRRLQAKLDAQEARLKVLEGTVARLKEQLAAARKDSSTSSKPPSSDIVKPPKPAPPEGQQRRRIGGQPGHPKHERAAFPPELINGDSLDHRLDLCPGCGHDLEPMPTIMPRVIQQVDINDVPLVIQEHRGHPGWCSHCQKVYEAPLPIGIERGGLVGPRLTTVIAYLKGVCHASFSTVRKFVRDVLRLTISRGQLANIIAKVSQTLEQPYQELLESLPDQKWLNVDETGHKQNRLRQWTWCFRAGLYTLFKIDPTRSADVLIEVLGAEFNGVLGCDYFSAYRRYLPRVRRVAPVLPGPPDPRREVPHDAARRKGSNVWDQVARGVAGTLWGDPPPGVADGRAVPGPARGGTGQGATMRHTQCAGDEPLSQPGQAVRGAWGELFPVHHDPGSGADQ